MIFTVFKKELIDTLRDRRTLIVMIIVPILLFPIIMKVSAFFANNFKDEAQNKTLKVAVVGEHSALMDALRVQEEGEGKIEFITYSDTLKIDQDIRDEQIDLGMYISEGFEEALQTGKSGEIQLFYNAVEVGVVERLENRINAYKAKISQERLERLGIDLALFEPIVLVDRNIASDQEMIGKMAGGILPYVFILFGFLGCMYPAIDLFTGEKERGTIETILTTPDPRWKILTGKMMVVALSGFMASVFGILGLYLASAGLGDVNESISTTINQLFTPKSLISMMVLILPLVIFFAGLIIPIAIYAKSFKEAQSMASPLNILVIFPAMVGMFPGIAYSVTTAFIPVVNVVLATKEILAGTLDWGLYIGTFVSLCLLASISVILSYRQFGKETNISSN